MDVLAFFPARYAENSPDGTMTIVSGGMIHVKVDSFPFMFRSLAVVAKVLLDEDDASAPHVMKVRLVNPAGDVSFETEEFETPVDALPPDMDYLNVDLALVLSNALFQSEGRYWFELLFDGELIKRTPFRLKLKVPSGTPP
jgi:hypothetical protein